MLPVAPGHLDLHWPNMSETWRHDDVITTSQFFWFLKNAQTNHIFGLFLIVWRIRQRICKCLCIHIYLLIYVYIVVIPKTRIVSKVLAALFKTLALQGNQHLCAGSGNCCRPLSPVSWERRKNIFPSDLNLVSNWKNIYQCSSKAGQEYSTFSPVSGKKHSCPQSVQERTNKLELFLKLCCSLLLTSVIDSKHSKY